MKRVAMLDGVVVACIYEIYVTLNGIRIQVRPRGCGAAHLGNDTRNKMIRK